MVADQLTMSCGGHVNSKYVNYLNLQKIIRAAHQKWQDPKIIAALTKQIFNIKTKAVRLKAIRMYRLADNNPGKHFEPTTNSLIALNSLFGLQELEWEKECKKSVILI